MLEPELKKSYLLDEIADGPRMITPRGSLGDEVYEVLLAEVISFALPPGERLSVDGLSRRLGVSQTPIRAALIRLEAEGLVVKKQNIGYSVAPQLSGSRFREIYEFRLLLEPALAALAAERVSAADLAKIESLNAEMASLTSEDTHANYSKFALLDSAFHSRIAEASGNSVAVDALERLYTHMHLFRLRYHATIAMQAVKEHVAIVDALRQRDPQTANNAMRVHIETSRERMQPFYNEQ